MTIELESMAVEMPEVKGHPNRAAFRGVLTVVDVPSDRAPWGSHGKRVVLTRRAAEKAIPSLIGMAVDYAPSLDQHDQQRKVGVITSADLVGRDLAIGGYLYAKDFPEIVNEIARVGRRPLSGFRRPTRGFGDAASTFEFRTQDPGHNMSAAGNEGARLRACLAMAVREIRAMLNCPPVKLKKPVVLRAESVAEPQVAAAARSGEGLGMSFEVTNVNVLNASARVLRLINVTFTGAAILRKDKAAYQDTWIELV